MATRSIWTTSMVLALVYACTDPALPDAGVMDSGANDAGSDAGVVTCAATSECDDGLFCNGEERCMDAVCVPGAPACGTGECDEGRDSCVCSGNPDRDEDGHDSLACDGDDCDDDDPLRFPGNGEVCDAEGHDEDCDEATVGERDADGDGFIDSACCNGSTCGRDCDDRFRGINPDEMELCNAIDDNCDGRVDEPVAFCPTGMCVANRCASVSWERVIDSVGREDNATGLAVDSAGNVYLGVLLDADADVDADGTLEPAGTHLVSYDASGRVRWAVPTDGSYGMSGTANDASLVLYDQTTLVFR